MLGEGEGVLGIGAGYGGNRGIGGGGFEGFGGDGGLLLLLIGCAGGAGGVDGGDRLGDVGLDLAVFLIGGGVAAGEGERGEEERGCGGVEQLLSGSVAR